MVGFEAAAALDDQPAVGPARAFRESRGGVEAGRVGGRSEAAAQVLESAARDHEHEEVEDGEEAELEGY